IAAVQIRFVCSCHKRLWSLRFESKHSYFKRSVRRTQNRHWHTTINSVKHICTQSHFFSPKLKSVDLTTYTPHLYSDAVHKAVETSMLNEPDSVVTQVEYKGTRYRKGNFICLKCEEVHSVLQVGQIELIFIKDDEVTFLVTPHSALYLSDYGLFEILPATKEMICVNAEDCLDYYPLNEYSFMGLNVMTLKHSVVNL
ncbi:hypothetical protein, partial [Enterococcus larvae]|uniref:hypothetical protein n=1 Tax=Enterococcus larvae TaxID=2794352 RepID=UPI003F407051